MVSSFVFRYPRLDRVLPTRPRLGLPSEIVVGIVGELWPNQRIALSLGDFSTRFGPPFARVATWATQDYAAVFDEHFRLSLEACLNE